MKLFIKEHIKTLIIGASIIIAVTIHECFNRYYVHTAYKHTTIIDRWTGREQ